LPRGRFFNRDAAGSEGLQVVVVSADNPATIVRKKDSPMPLKSMTGFGQAEGTTPSGSYRVELRSVNNRYFELQVRMPKLFASLEPRVKQAVSSQVSRGSISLFVSSATDQTPIRLSWDKEKVDNYIRIFKEVKSAYELKGDITISDLVRFGDFIKTESVEFNDETLWEHLGPIIERSLADFQKSRETEARFLAADIKKMIKAMSADVKKIEKRAPLRLKEYRQELTKRVEQLIKNPPEPARVATEIAIMADRMDIAEEITRLKAHLEKFLDMFESDEQVGKRMNFILQELNREANTIGSKANDLEISHLSMYLKENIEKIREQIQNIE
jgi:uncharacterized protein (TIGR00255 family)